MMNLLFCVIWLVSPLDGECIQPHKGIKLAAQRTPHAITTITDPGAQVHNCLVQRSFFGSGLHWFVPIGFIEGIKKTGLIGPDFGQSFSQGIKVKYFIHTASPALQEKFPIILFDLMPLNSVSQLLRGQLGVTKSVTMFI